MNNTTIHMPDQNRKFSKIRAIDSEKNFDARTILHVNGRNPKYFKIEKKDMRLKILTCENPRVSKF